MVDPLRKTLNRAHITLTPWLRVTKGSILYIDERYLPKALFASQPAPNANGFLPVPQNNTHSLESELKTLCSFPGQKVFTPLLPFPHFVVSHPEFKID